ncbi:Tyrocidine synthase 3 [Kordia antarctica]|uniref:Tyrocidine synthase 3 n=1 Tax=Kordia antarctica TaxID=1218801 RepID=A0A7L4ZFF6_9FLAO|nr:non-ribosomal peptide synthetase [Kordia antarctica]QHI35393.1 Tyrocidine synthase 3 [Kordia antarctica]
MKLTLPQQDVYFEQLLYPDEPIYNIGAKIPIEGIIDAKIFNQAYKKLIDQHDAYRSIVINDIQNPRIEILADHNSDLGFLDFSMESNPDEKANQYMQTMFGKAFNFDAKSLLHTFILVKVHDTFHYLFSMYHHIITDGWGTSVMFQRLVQNYNELSEHGKVISEYPYSYETFVEDDELYAKSEDYQKDKAYWLTKFENLPAPLFKRIDETIYSNKSKRKTIHIERSVYDKLTEIAKANRASTFHIILATLYLYFARKHQNNDISIGLPVLNRGKSIFKKTVGLFMGISALRIPLDFDASFEELIQTIRQQLRQDYRHQRFPLGKLIQEKGVFKEREQLFNITLSYEKQDYADHFANTKTKVIPLTHQSERVALAIYIREFDVSESVTIDFDYNTNYFEAEAISQAVMHFEELLQSIIKNPSQKLSDYSYITNTEQQQLIHTFNETETPLPKKATVLSAFNEVAKKYSTKIAIQDFEKQYTYAEVDRISKAIALEIQDRFSGKDTAPIAVLMERSADLVLTLLGILKSGHSYIPLDPSFPKERLNYITKHSNVNCVVGNKDLKHLINSDVVFIDVEKLIHSKKHSDQELKEVTSEASAYIIYTSGSTGNPKGVEIGHEALINFLQSIKNHPGVENHDILYSVTTQSFDISILEFFTPLIVGATLYVVANKTLDDPLVIIDEIQKVQPTIMQGTPSFYQMLYNVGWKGDQQLKILCGGDLLSESLAQKLLDTSYKVWNMYGPTETTIWSSIKPILSAKDASNIGKPIQNTSFYILDDYMQLLPVNTPGKIYIGGKGLAKGYFKDEYLTSQKFIKNPFKPEEIIYDTSDLGKWTIDGEIEFLGRNDNQVKIRGYRIELGDIETQLNEIKNIKSSVVIAKKRKDHEVFLVAYLISEKEGFDYEEVIKHLRSKLPEYMIPYTLIAIDEFPLTPNKKVDRKQLAQLETIQNRAEEVVVLPTSKQEKELYKFYKKVLERDDDFSISTSFFALGGHSLNAVRLIGLIEKKYQQRLSLKDIFNYPDISSLVNYLQNKSTSTLQAITPVKPQEYYPITFPQYMIWLASLQSEKSIAYNMSGVYTIEGEMSKELLERAFLGIIQKYEIFRTNFIEVNGNPYQKINSTTEVNFSVDEMYTTSDKYDDAVKEYTNKEFQLEHDMLIRVALFHTENQNCTLVFTTHHVMMDGWSLEIIVKEITSRYSALATQKSLTEEKLDFQYKDFVVWQNNIEQQNEASNREFWTNYLQKHQWKTLIPYDYSVSEEKYTGSFHIFHWPKKFMDDLNEIAVQNNVTLHTLLMTSFHVLLHKLYGIDDICVGTINSGRTFSGLENQVGMFVKTLPLRSSVTSNDSFLALMKNMHENLLTVDEHQDITEDVLNTLRFEAILVLQNQTFNYGKFDLTEDVALHMSPVITKYNRLPLLIDFSVKGEHLRGSILYDTTKYEEETMNFFTVKYEKFLQQILSDITTPIHAIDIDFAFEKEETISIDFNF